MRIAIVDSDVVSLMKSVRMLDQYLYERNCEAEIAVFLTAEDLLARCAHGTRYDAYLLEVHLPNMGGITLGGKIREFQPEAPLVYVTTVDSDAAQPVPSAGLVRKPCTREVFAEALDRALGVAR